MLHVCRKSGYLQTPCYIVPRSILPLPFLRTAKERKKTLECFASVVPNRKSVANNV